MRKQILSLLLAVFVMAGAAFAQGGQRQTPEERITATMEKMAALNLTAEQQVSTKKIMTEFFEAQQKSMEDMRASGTMDRDAMMAKRKELSDARDGKLKLIFNGDQMKKWIDEVEPSLRPQRRQGQGQGGN
ncbi:MAG: hypothetical protein ABIW38_03270 [Ferruginibacter sp.]